MTSVFSSRRDPRKLDNRLGNVRAPKQTWLNRCVLGLFVMGWMLGSAGGKPCCCQTAVAAQASIVQAHKETNAKRVDLPPCCVQHLVSAKPNQACEQLALAGHDYSKAQPTEALECDCPCCVSQTPIAVLHEPLLTVERTSHWQSDWAVVDWQSSLAIASRPPLNSFASAALEPPFYSAPERLAWLSRWIK